MSAWSAGFRRAAVGLTGTAVFCQVRQQGIHLRVVRAHADDATLSRVGNELGGTKDVEMRGERRRRDPEFRAQIANREASMSGLDESPKSGKPGFVTECRECAKRV